MSGKVLTVSCFMLIFSQVCCDTTVQIKLLNYTVTTHGIQQGTTEERCCVTGKILKPFICTSACSPNVRFCVQTDPFDIGTCSAETMTSQLPPQQTYEAGSVLGNISNPLTLTVKSWSVSTHINISISAEQFNYTLLLARSANQPLIWPVPKTEPVNWITVVDAVDRFQTIVYQYKIFETSTATVLEDNLTIPSNCQVGYTGTNCDVDIDECVANNTCGSGTVCVNTQGSYKCFCDGSGLGRPNCEIDVDECGEHSICKSPATCINTLGSYQCLCFGDGFTGQNCDIDIDECAANVCNNSATCTNSPGSYACQCQEGYQGQDCIVDVDECVDGRCGEYRQCENYPGSFRCVCSPGYTGEYCRTDIDECAARPCYNGGICTNRPGAFRCDCQSGYTGKYCNIDIDECAARPCFNGGICTNRPGAFRCDCQSGYTGKYCNIDIDECAARPCFNGGICTNRPGAFRCDCQSGYTGKYCNIDIDECAARPCFNGGICTNRPGAFRCDCKNGFSGHVCQLLVTQTGRSLSSLLTTTPHRPGLCKDVPGFPCNSNFNMCLDNNIADRYCRKTCERCSDGLGLIG